MNSRGKFQLLVRKNVLKISQQLKKKKIIQKLKRFFLNFMTYSILKNSFWYDIFSHSGRFIHAKITENAIRES